MLQRRNVAMLFKLQRQTAAWSLDTDLAVLGCLYRRWDEKDGQDATAHIKDRGKLKIFVEDCTQHRSYLSPGVPTCME